MNRKVFFGLFFLLFCVWPLTSSAQNITTVTGTVTDPNGLPYSNGHIAAQLVPNGVTPTINGQTVSAFTAANLDVTGSFTMNLASNAVISPGGTQWQFTVSITPGIAPPAGTGPQSFVVTLTVSGASQSITSNLSGAAPALSIHSASGNFTAPVAVTVSAANGTPALTVNYTPNTTTGGNQSNGGIVSNATSNLSGQYTEAGSFNCTETVTNSECDGLSVNTYYTLSNSYGGVGVGSYQYITATNSPSVAFSGGQIFRGNTGVTISGSYIWQGGIVIADNANSDIILSNITDFNADGPTNGTFSWTGSGTNYYGFSATFNSLSSGSFSNAYAFYAAPLLIGNTLAAAFYSGNQGSNYAWYSAGGKHFFGGPISAVNSVPTAGPLGVGILVADQNLIAQGANISSTPFYAVPSGGAGYYQATCYVVLTRAASSTSTLPQCQVAWTDADTSVVEPAFNLNSTSTSNAVGTVGPPTEDFVPMNVAASTTISYSTASYASSGATSMQYAVHLRLVYLGS